jgi:hypothetical protein
MDIVYVAENWAKFTVQDISCQTIIHFNTHYDLCEKVIFNQKTTFHCGKPTTDLKPLDRL